MPSTKARSQSKDFIAFSPTQFHQLGISIKTHKLGMWGEMEHSILHANYKSSGTLIDMDESYCMANLPLSFGFIQKKDM